MDGIILTMDIDWAHDDVIEYALAILDHYKIDATIFMTHKVDVDLRNHEIALHPNFTTLNLESHIRTIYNIYPQAVGIRSHSLFYTERFRDLYPLFEIKYDSNVMMYCQEGIKPYYIMPNVIEMPLFWMDNFYLEMEKNPSFQPKHLALTSPGLKIFNFHPIHIFLNTIDLGVYENAKNVYKNPAELWKFRNNDINKGVEVFLIRLLSLINENNLKTYKTNEAVEVFTEQVDES